MYDLLLSVDKYNNPKVTNNNDTISLLLLRLLLLKKGSLQNNPDIGIDINNWRYTDMANLSDLEYEINNQISNFLPMLNVDSIEVTANGKYEDEISIKIVINNTMFLYRTEKNSVIRLNDLKEL